MAKYSVDLLNAQHRALNVSATVPPYHSSIIRESYFISAPAGTMSLRFSSEGSSENEW